MWSGWGAVRLRLRIAAAASVLVATIAVMATAAPRDGQAFAWKDVCTIVVFDSTGSLTGLKPKDRWSKSRRTRLTRSNGVRSGSTSDRLAFPGGRRRLSLITVGIPVTLGCLKTPTFKWGNGAVACTVHAPTSGRNIFQCLGGGAGNDPRLVKTRILPTTTDIKGVVDVGPPNVQVSQAGTVSASSAATSALPKRVRALLRRRDLPGRGWRVADKVRQFGRLGEILQAGSRSRLGAGLSDVRLRS
jgi:hypothetical protein